jgi:hypothetical protein
MPFADAEAPSFCKEAFLLVPLLEDLPHGLVVQPFIKKDVHLQRLKLRPPQESLPLVGVVVVQKGIGESFVVPTNRTLLGLVGAMEILKEGEITTVSE